MKCLCYFLANFYSQKYFEMPTLKIHKFFYCYLNFNVTTTGRDLAEMCRYEYPKYVKYGLWLLIEVGVIAATIPGGIDFMLVHNFP